MAATWKSVFNETIEGRLVEIEIYGEGGYRIHTTQGADDPGTVESDGSTHLIHPPTEKGRQLAIDVETLDEIHSVLVSEGFSENAAREIVSKISV